MEFIAAVTSRLSPAERDVLSGAIAQVDDFLLEEMFDLHGNDHPEAVNGRFSGLFLPSRYVDSYDFAMLRRLHVCSILLAGRLQDRWRPPTCRGEELVLRAVLDHAETCFDEQADEPTEAYANLRDVLFEDLDHEYLFAPEFDGIDDPDTYEGSQMGVRPLYPSAWFEPFQVEVPVHPMLACDSVSGPRG